MSAVWTLQREARIITDPQESAAGISGHHLTRAIFDPDERDDVGVNPSREPAIADLIAARMSRRAVLKGMAAAGFCGLFGGTVPARVGAAPTAGSALRFTEISRSFDDTTHVAPGYGVQVLIRWGDPIHKAGPPFRPGRQSAAAQEVQFGMDNDFIAFMPLPRGSRASDRGLLCVNHERNTAHLSWPKMSQGNYTAGMTRERCEVEMASQGHTVIEVARTRVAWRLIDDSRYNRRITCRSTVMRVAGPAAGRARLKTHADPTGVRVIGTLNNCAGGVTPWGTVLTAEENLHLYFIGKGKEEREARAWKRYGIEGRAIYQWGRFFERFNLRREPNEPNRFGWIVEIDPYDPKSTPVKRTALGRCKHECATTAMSHDGRVAVYSGDDQRMEYVYKFVTRRRFDRERPEANHDLLDDGTLFVAKFEADGRMKWLPLVFGQGPLTPRNGFADQGDVVIEARRAADLLGATPMDRPEDVEANPLTGRVYVVMTRNERRRPHEADAANPRGPNCCGHIIEITPPSVGGKPDHTATECAWGFFLLGGDPGNSRHGASYRGPVTSKGWLSCPDKCRIRSSRPHLDRNRWAGSCRRVRGQCLRCGNRRGGQRHHALLFQRAARRGNLRTGVHPRRHDAVPGDPASGRRDGIDVRPAFHALAGFHDRRAAAAVGGGHHQSRRRRDRLLTLTRLPSPRAARYRAKQPSACRAMAGSPPRDR